MIFRAQFSFHGKPAERMTFGARCPAEALATAETLRKMFLYEAVLTVVRLEDKFPPEPQIPFTLEN